MALDAHQTPRLRHQIADNNDLIVIVRGVEGYSGVELPAESTITVHEYEVSKAALCTHPYFEVVIHSKFADTGGATYELKDDDPAAVKVMLEHLHGTLDKSSLTVTTATIWNILVVARKYDFDPTCEPMKECFARWYERQSSFNITECREMLYPCYNFDHAEGFAAMTKQLAYNFAGHIEEHRPEGVGEIQREHRLPNNNIIRALNGAKSSLRTKLHLSLYGPVAGLLKKGTCKRKEHVLWAYLAALTKTRAWPFEIEGNKNSINELLRRLGKFEYTDPHSSVNCSPSSECRYNFKKLVDDAISRIRDHFDGLCLDCMRVSESGLTANGDEDEDYWRHAQHGPHDTSCRISHEHFSFLGRREKMDLFQGKARASKQG